MEEEGSCAICLEILEDHEISTHQLECHHQPQFHHRCLEEWIHVHNSCPLCRVEITIPVPLPSSRTGYEQLNHEGSRTYVHNVNIQDMMDDHIEGNISRYSFALIPQDHQPSGSINLNRLNNINMTFTSTTQNFLRVSSGMMFNN